MSENVLGGKALPQVRNLVTAIPGPKSEAIICLLYTSRCV